MFLPLVIIKIISFFMAFKKRKTLMLSWPLVIKIFYYGFVLQTVMSFFFFNLSLSLSLTHTYVTYQNEKGTECCKRTIFFLESLVYFDQITISSFLVVCQRYSLILKGCVSRDLITPNYIFQDAWINISGQHSYVILQHCEIFHCFNFNQLYYIYFLLLFRINMVYYQQEYLQPIIYVTIIYLIANFQIDIILFQIKILCTIQNYIQHYTSPNFLKK
jgi:hypothetical protein